MPRIRTIKPEFWDSPSTARASAVARLLYIAMWNWADDYGRGTANLKELEGFAFPNDDVAELSGGKSRKFRDTVEEVSDCFGVVFYNVRGRPYYAISSWDDHQKTERKARSKHPGPDEADSLPDKVKRNSEGNTSTFLHAAEELPRSSGTGTGEQGNRGTGEQLTTLVIADAPTDDDDDPAALHHSKSKSTPYTPEFLEWWGHYPRKTSKGDAFKAWKQIPDRDLEALIAGADRYTNDPNRLDEYTKHPGTWLRSRCWEDETPLPERTQQQRTYVPSWQKRLDANIQAAQADMNREHSIFEIGE